MNEMSTGTFLEYEIAYRAERLQGRRAPVRAARRVPSTARFLRNRRAR